MIYRTRRALAIHHDFARKRFRLYRQSYHLSCRTSARLCSCGDTRPACLRAPIASGTILSRLVALLLAYYDADGPLIYAGRAGTGIGHAELERLWRCLQLLATPEMPLD